MAGLKRKSVSETTVVTDSGSISKKIKASPAKEESKKKNLPGGSVKKTHKKRKEESEEELVESDTTEEENGFYGFSAKEGEGGDDFGGFESDAEEDGNDAMTVDGKVKRQGPRGKKANPQEKEFREKQKNLAKDSANVSSKESHAKQKALAKERKAAKPNADSIARAKKLWEQLRMKSHVKLEERKALVEELFSIITGNVKDFVFKHDSVRIIQCALKYANMEQKKMITRELKGEFKSLAESRYAKFLIAKLLVEGDEEIKEAVISEFYGHVRRLINHPEAAWILDDAYRGAATKNQKAILLREWYGQEFALFKATKKDDKAKVSADLSKILEESPEKRKPILNELHLLINQLVQKKLTGFTMLHDAMLQYYLNLKAESEEWTEFFDLLKDDEEGDLLKNLAFTKSGARIVCYALAYSDAKGRRHLLKVYKDTMEMLAYDVNGHNVLLTAYEVIDDTKMSAKAIFPELLGPDANVEAQQEKTLALANHLTGRIPLLYLLAGPAKWLVTDEHTSLLAEIHEIRSKTSKKDANVRRKELISYFSETVITAIANRASDFASTSFGCYFVVEALLGASSDKAAALEAIAELASGDPNAEEHIAKSSACGRMLKRLVEGGHFDSDTKEVVLVEPALGFADILYAKIQDRLVDWATGPSSFVVVGLLESKEFGQKDEVLKTLRKSKNALEKSAEGEQKVEKTNEDKKGKKKGDKGSKGNVGARILLEKL